MQTLLREYVHIVLIIGSIMLKNAQFLPRSAAVKVQCMVTNHLC